MSNDLSLRIRIAKIFNSYCGMLDSQQRNGGCDCQTIVDDCIDRMHIEWLEMRVGMCDARDYAKRMVDLARSYGMQPMSDEALRAMQVFGIA